MRYDTIIWDLDGTLLDTIRDLAAATNHALRFFGMPTHTVDDVRYMVGNGVRKLMERATPGGEQNPRFEEVFAAFKQYYVAHCRDTARPYPGIPETLRELKTRGVTMAIVSNKLQAGVTELRETWFRDTIDVAIGGHEGARLKPAPDMVQEAMRELQASGEAAVYVGDSDVDLLTAKSSGLPCIAAAWGFRGRDFLLEHGAATIIDTPQQIIRHIEGELFGRQILGL